MKQDQLVEEVRSARQDISRECEHDIWKLYARYAVVQTQMKTEGKRRFISQPPVGSKHEVSSVTSLGNRLNGERDQ